jgi:hypothetical protein
MQWNIEADIWSPLTLTSREKLIYIDPHLKEPLDDFIRYIK